MVVGKSYIRPCEDKEGKENEQKIVYREEIAGIRQECLPTGEPNEYTQMAVHAEQFGNPQTNERRRKAK